MKEFVADMDKLKKRLDCLQARVSNTRVYGAGIEKDVRKLLMEYIKETQMKVI